MFNSIKPFKFISQPTRYITISKVSDVWVDPAYANRIDGPKKTNNWVNCVNHTLKISIQKYSESTDTACFMINQLERIELFITYYQERFQNYSQKFICQFEYHLYCSNHPLAPQNGVSGNYKNTVINPKTKS